MAKKRKAQKAEAKVPVDPNATVFAPGDEIVVKRRVLWTGYGGVVQVVDGGMCLCLLHGPSGKFPAAIPAAELQFDL